MSLGLKLAPRKYPISKASVRLKLFHSALGSQLWVPFLHSNGGAFLPSHRITHRFVKRVFHQVNDNRLNVEGYLYTHSPQVFRHFNNHSFTVRPSYGLEEMVRDIQAFRRLVQKYGEKHRQLEVNKRFTLILLDLSPADLRALSGSLELQQNLIDVLTNSEQERLAVFLLTHKAEAVPQLIHRALHWSVFLGEENAAVAKTIYKAPEEVYNEHRQTLGLLKKREEEVLIPLHDLLFNPSEWKTLMDEYVEVEEAAFEKFLEGLS